MQKNYFRAALEVLGLVLLFVSMQIVGTVIGGMYHILSSGMMGDLAETQEMMSQEELFDVAQERVQQMMSDPAVVATVTVYGLLVSSLLIIGICVWRGWTRTSNNSRTTWQSLVWGMLIMLCLLVPVNFAAEQAEVSDVLAGVLEQMMQSWVGVLCIAVLGPIAEEVMFRGAIQGTLMRAMGGTPTGLMTAIILQAVIFGAVHGNPAQVYGAAIDGFFFGLVCYRTGSIWPSILMHIANNSTAVLLVYTAGADATLTDLLGGDYLCLAVSIASIVMLWLLLTKYCYYKETSQ